MMKITGRKVWFITGISSGLGRALIRAVVQHGDFAIGTLRNQEQVDSFNANHKGKAEAIKLDVTKAEDIQAAAEYIQSNFGRIDVLVNNAGFGFAGSIEESSMEEVRQVFECNFFGALLLTQKFLPLFRSQKSGHVIHISSHGGIKAFPGFGIYNASKFALEGISEALASEVAALGIKVSIVEPGPFRTNFAGQSFKNAENTIAEYDQTSGVFRERMKEVNGKQEGDPVKAAQAIISLTLEEKPSLRLPLGKIAVTSIRSKIDSLTRDLEANLEIAENSIFSSGL